MQLQGRRFAHWLPDGVTVRHFDAIANGKLIVLRAEGQPVATVVAPTFRTRNKWALTEPVTIDGETYVLAVGYVSPLGCVCRFFVNGIDARTGSTLEQARGRGQVWLGVDMVVISTRLMAYLPHVCVVGMSYGLYQSLSVSAVAIIVVVLALSMAVGVLLSRIGLRVLGWIKTSARPGLTGVLGFSTWCGAVALATAAEVLILTAVRPMLATR